MIEGDSIMVDLGLKDKSIKQIERVIKIKSTKLKIFIAKIDSDNENEPTNTDSFYSLKARYEGMMGDGFRISSNVSLVEWIGIIDELKKRNKQN